MFKWKRPRLGLHQRLVRTGWFKGGIGPFGGCPVQVFARLNTGELLYFRARNDMVEMEISIQGQQPHRKFSQQVNIPGELGAGAMPVSMAVDFIERWLTEYLGEMPVQKEGKMGGKLVEWWSSLNDLRLLGLQLCFAAAGQNRCSISSRRDMFHNGNRPVPGVQMQLGKLVLQLSSARHWDE